MCYDYKKLKISDEEEIKIVSDIICECGRDMYERKGLLHWKNGYPIDSVMNDIEKKDVYLVYSENKPVATFSVTTAPSSFFSDDKKCLYISKVAVIPEKSGCGIGGKCMEYITHLALSKKCEALRLDVYDKSIDAVRFYEKRGFVNLKSERTKFFIVYCMEKNIKGE